MIFDRGNEGMRIYVCGGDMRDLLRGRKLHVRMRYSCMPCSDFGIVANETTIPRHRKGKRVYIRVPVVGHHVYVHD